MTLDEAIAYEEWAAENSSGEVSDEHRQLAEWLRQARDAAHLTERICGLVDVNVTLGAMLRAREDDIEKLRDTCLNLRRVVDESVELHDELHEHQATIDGLTEECAELRNACGELLRMAQANEPDFLHWPEIHDELRKLGVEVEW